jgi:hypothetical protein
LRIDERKADINEGPAGKLRDSSVSFRAVRVGWLLYCVEISKLIGVSRPKAEPSWGGIVFPEGDSRLDGADRRHSDCYI